MSDNIPVEFNPALDEPSFSPDEDTQGYDLSQPMWAVCIFDRIDGTHEGHPRLWEWLGTKEEAIDYAKTLVFARDSVGSIVASPTEGEAYWVPAQANTCEEQ